MKAYITRINGWSLRDKSHYMQNMVAETAHQLGCRELGIYRYHADGESEDSLNSRLDGIIAGINSGDLVICQLPTGNGLKFERTLVTRIKAYGGRVAILVHELEALADAGRFSTLGETIGLYNQAEVLIVPTYAMKKYLQDNGITDKMKFIVQEMWDYVADDRFSHTPVFHKEILVTDGDSSVGINGWNSSVPLKVYASSVSGGQNIQNIGELEPDQLFAELSKGGFGLVWYRDEYFHQYMKYATSFSVARYLAAGIPVIVPTGISSRSIIEENHLGLVVNSLEEAATAVESMEESEYWEYVRCVEQFAPALRKGYYTKKCLINAMQAFYRKDVGRILIPEESYRLEECVFTSTELHESYGGNMALTWCFSGKADAFLICDDSGKVLYTTKNLHQHYFLLKGYGVETGFVVKACIETLKGRLIIAESEQTYLRAKQYDVPKVSLIMPAYNAEDYIVRSIDTALAQTFSDLEIVIVDDGSTDSTSDIIDWYAGKYSNVKVIHQSNGGTPAARNTGIVQAKGEFIGFMDNDDMIHPDMIAKLYYSAKKNDCDIAITSICFIDNGTYAISMFSQYPMEEDMAINVDRFFDVHSSSGAYQFSVIWNKLYRASLIKERLIPLIIFDDEAWIPYVFSFADRICYLDEGLYEYDRSIRSSTLAHEWFKSSDDEIFERRKRAILFYLDNGNSDKLEKLKGVAQKQLVYFEKVYGNPAYANLWEEIRETYGKAAD